MSPALLSAPRPTATRGATAPLCRSRRGDCSGAWIPRSRGRGNPGHLAAYHRCGELATRGKARGAEESYGDDAFDEIARAERSPDTDPSYVHDLADNRRATVEDPGAGGLNLTTGYLYDANDNQIAETDPRGAAGGEPGDYTTVSVYDARDQLVGTEDPFGGTTSYERDDIGRVIAETSPNGNATATAGDYTTDYTYFPTGEVKTRSIPWRSGQYGKDDAALDALQVAYERDGAGNPTKITDARGNSFTNKFLYTGELIRTTRPSWWTLDYSGGQGGGGPAAGMPDPGVRYGATGGGNQADTELALGGPKLVERSGYARDSDEAAAGADPSQPASPTDFGRVLPEPLGSMMPAAGETTFAYDNELRLTAITDAQQAERQIAYDGEGRITTKSWPFKPGTRIIHTFGYDRNDNLTIHTNQGIAAWSWTYDEFDRAIEESAPGAASSSTGDILPELTKLAYDRNGNLTRRTTPRGVAFDFNFAYDQVDRLTREENPAGEAWSYAYDAAGNRTAESSPRSFTQTTSYDPLSRPTETTDLAGESTTYEYDFNGNTTRVEAPGAAASPGGSEVERTTITTYDGRDLPWQTTTGTLADKRTTITEYDPNGNLRRTVNPAGVDGSGAPDVDDTGDASAAAKDATVNIHNADDQLVKTHLPWEGQSDRRYLQAFKRDALGRAYAVRAPHEADEQAPTTCYEHYDNGWIKSSSDQQLVGSEQNNCPASLHEHQLTYDYDRAGNQSRWESRTFGASAKGRKVTRSFFANGTLAQRRAVATVAGNEQATTARAYNYYYNANRSLVLFFDQTNKRETAITRDPAERESAVNERWGAGRDTLYTYDGSGNVARVRTDGTWLGGTGYGGGKSTSFAYDSAERESETRVDPPAAGGPTRETDTAYHPSGEIATRTRTQGPGSDESLYFNAHGEISRMRRERDGSDDEVKNQGYAYDRNGNRTTDERGTHTYNARDQLTSWDRAPDVPHGEGGSGDRVEYELNGSGAITEKRDLATEITTTYEYPTGDRLTRSVATDASEAPDVTTTTTFTYDDFGEMRTARSVSDEPGAVASTTHYTYDEFERRTGSYTQADGQPREEEATYAYDGLDRRDTRTKPHGAGSADDELFEYSYVGTSESLSREAKVGDPSNVETYDYDSAGRRQGQLKGGTFRTYAKDANGSTTALEQADGSVEADDAYDYDPYGELERDDDQEGDPQDPEEGLSAEAKANPFRYEGFYYDSGVKTYDMQARSYRPEIGRFTSQDRYEQASSDLELQADPLTQNRYAFAGGNPVSRVEFDGHCSFNRGGAACRRKLEKGTAKRVVVTTAGGTALSFTSPEALAAGQYKELSTSYVARQSAVSAVENHPARTNASEPLNWSSVKQASKPELNQVLGWLDDVRDEQRTSCDFSCNVGGFFGGAAGEAKNVWHSASHPAETAESLAYAVQHPLKTVEALATSCDGVSPGECLGGVTAGILGSKGAATALKALAAIRKAPDGPGGESPEAAYGRMIHDEWDYGEGFEKEFGISGGALRADAVNVDDRIVVELKPNNPQAIARGWRKLETYRRSLEDEVGGEWEVRLETYDRP